MSHTEIFNQIMKQSAPTKKPKIILQTINERENMNALQTSISKCKFCGNVVYLPTEILSNYADVRKAFLNAGATYQRNTFVFPNDAKPYIERLMGGESVNIKKEFQFFATPSKLADMLVILADIKADDRILEPSAGQGAIIEAVLRFQPNRKYPIDYCELMDINSDILAKKFSEKEAVGCLKDFLPFDESFRYDKIIANPPFNKNQDIEHITKMFKLLDDGGKIVSIASNSWRKGQQKKQIAFREWLESLNAEIIKVPHGMFKESGTEISCCIILINN